MSEKNTSNEIEELKEELLQLQENYKQLHRKYKSKNRELLLLKNQQERNKAAFDAKSNVSQVIAAKRSELERYMNLLMENFPDIVLLFDKENRIVYSTDSFLKCCNMKALGMIKGFSYEKLLSPYLSQEFLERLNKVFLQIAKQKEMIELSETIDFRQEGNVRNYSIQIAPMLSSNNVMEGSMVFFYDMTEIIDAKKAAERASAVKSDFLATMSHEIRTPMNVIIGVSNMLKNSGLNSEQMEYLNKIENSSDALLTLINDILDFSKIEAKKLVISPEFFELENLFTFANSMFELMFQKKGIQYYSYMDENLPKIIYGDETRICQILTNLLSNALKYTEKGRVSFGIKADDSGNICFEVKDTGIGIKEKALTKVFMAFEQLELVRNKKTSGTGLGLAITKQLCILMNGTIDVKSKYGEGSCFTVKLPLPIGEEKNRPVEKDVIDFTAPQIRILLVDDMEINLEITEYMLIPYQIITDRAVSGLEAIDKVKANTYDLIFMDHMMPIMDGVEATKVIRTLGKEMEKVPIIALTANTANGVVDLFLKNGLNDVLPKPVNVSALAECLLKWLPNDKIILAEK